MPKVELRTGLRGEARESPFSSAGRQRLLSVDTEDSSNGHKIDLIWFQ